MPILKNTTADNGAAVGFHKAVNANVNFATGVVALTVSSWTDAASYNAGNGQVWQWHLVATPACLSDIEAYLLTVDPFIGGSILADDFTSLDAQRARQWAILKAQRDAAINGGFTWTGTDGVASKFDSDLTAQGRISGAFSLASNPTTASLAFPKTWKLFDNTTRSLSAADMVSVGVTLAGFVQGLIDQGDALLTQIDAATDAATIGAITWPT